MRIDWFPEYELTRCFHLYVYIGVRLQRALECLNKYMHILYDSESRWMNLS